MLVNLNARQNQSEMKASSSNGTSTGFSIRKKNPTGSPYLEGISVETDTAVSRDQSHKEAPIQLSKINNVCIAISPLLSGGYTYVRTNAFVVDLEAVRIWRRQGRIRSRAGRSLESPSMSVRYG